MQDLYNTQISKRTVYQQSRNSVPYISTDKCASAIANQSHRFIQ